MTSTSNHDPELCHLLDGNRVSFVEKLILVWFIRYLWLCRSIASSYCGFHWISV